MKLTNREALCLYIGFLSGQDLTQEFKSRAMELTCKILKTDYDTYLELFDKSQKALHEVNETMLKMIKNKKKGKDLYDERGDDKDWV